MLPAQIYELLAKSVLGQEWSLKRIAVAVYKHLNGLPAGNILLIGNSGTGKTTIMKALRHFYGAMPELAKFQVMIIINANMLAGEEPGDVRLQVLFNNLENEARRLLGPSAVPEQIRELVENATVCIDEIDKISARIAGKVNPAGIALQQSLLTILEGEKVMWARDEGQVAVDTSKMLFVAGGAFEELYEQIFTTISNHGDDRRFMESMRRGTDGSVQYAMDFQLKDHLRLTDLFTYGMVPQFISRFSAIGVLGDLGKKELISILTTAPDSPYLLARNYFQAMNIELSMAEDAMDLVALHAQQTSRVGARALRVVLGKIIAPLEFDPFASSQIQKTAAGHTLRIDKAMVEAALR